MAETEPTATVKIAIPSEIRLVDLVHAAAEKMAEYAGFDVDEALNVGLAVREAVINAMVHGNGGDPTINVDLTLAAANGGIEATVRDHGHGFDPDQAPDPRNDDNLLRTSGRGLLLIRAFVDDVVFKRRKGGGMEIRLIKQLPSVKEAAKNT